jgi:hypothetical protein
MTGVPGFESSRHWKRLKMEKRNIFDCLYNDTQQNDIQHNDTQQNDTA